MGVSRLCTVLGPLLFKYDLPIQFIKAILYTDDTTVRLGMAADMASIVLSQFRTEQGGGGVVRAQKASSGV